MADLQIIGYVIISKYLHRYIKKTKQTSKNFKENSGDCFGLESTAIDPSQ